MPCNEGHLPACHELDLRTRCLLARLRTRAPVSRTLRTWTAGGGGATLHAPAEGALTRPSFFLLLQNFAGVSRYVEALLEARKGKNLTKDAALDAVTGDVNMFGVMMVAMGDAGGMVSGSIHTTAATIRPAMQVLKTPNLVSSVFFMCLPDKVRLGAQEVVQ